MPVRNDFTSEIAAAAAKVTPPITVAAGTAMGAIDPQWFVAIPTVVYVVAQLGYLLWKWHREWKTKRG